MFRKKILGYAPKIRVEICLIILMICGFLVFLWMNSLPIPSTNLERIASSDADRKLKNDLKECEEKFSSTKLLYADKLAELVKLREKVDHGNFLKDNVEQLITAKLNLEAQETHTVTRRMLEISNYLPTYDPETIQSNPAYNIHKTINCWAPDCLPEILNNRQAYANCSNPLATTWNAVGMKYMERFVSQAKNYTELGFNQKRYRDEAFYAFQNATALDPTCWRARVNWALVFMQFDDCPLAINHLELAIKEEGKDARTWAILGIAQDRIGQPNEAQVSWAKALELDPYIGERKYFGIMMVNDMVPERHVQAKRMTQHNRDYEIPMCIDVLTFIEFSPVSISNYAVLHPGTQEFFVKNQFIVLRDIIPPFVLRAVANCFINLRTHGSLQLGDNQSKRYPSYNCRTGRTLHYQLVDLLRRVVVHNLHPTYSFYGGYVGGAVLTPHSDKPQCEFTISLTLSQYPENADPWVLSLGKLPTFTKDDHFGGKANEKMPPEDQVADAVLYPGDGLLFMGRHLVHFRRDAFPEGHELDQIFFHNVRDDFEGIYDI